MLPKLQIGFERLPKELEVIDGGACVVQYIKVETDQKVLAFIDPFALDHAFLYKAYPDLIALEESPSDRIR